MNDKELGLDVFEMADDEEIRRIAADCPASPEEKERMFKLSQKIYNGRTNESNEAPAEVVSGVEQYKKPIWHKIVSAAAALALVAGLGAGGVMFLSRHSGGNDQFAGSDMTVSDVECKVSSYPFGEIDRVRMLCPATAPAAIELENEDLNELVTMLYDLPWEEMSDKQPADGERFVLHIYNNNDPYLLFVNILDGSISYCKDVDGKTETKLYSGSEKIIQFLNSIELDPEKFLYAVGNESAKNNSSDIWKYVHVGTKKGFFVPDLMGKNIELAKEQLKEVGLNCEVVKIESTEIQPDYVVKTEPEAGTELRKGGTVTLYVSQGADAGGVFIVPDFTGKTADDAVIEAGYRNLKVTTFPVPSDEKEGTIIEQYPAKDTKLSEGQDDIVFFVSQGSITEGEVAYRFIIPKDIVLGSGRYSIDFIYEDEDGKINAVTAGTHELTPDVPVFLYRIQGKGNGKKVTAVITDKKTDKKANLGHYIFDFDNGTYTIEDEDIEGAFEATGY